VEIRFWEGVSRETQVKNQNRAKKTTFRVWQGDEAKKNIKHRKTKDSSRGARRIRLSIPSKKSYLKLFVINIPNISLSLTQMIKINLRYLTSEKNGNLHGEN